MRPAPLVPLLLVVMLLPMRTTAHPLDGPRVDLCASGHAVVGEEHGFFGRFTIADRPDSDHIGKLGFASRVHILVDGQPVASGSVWHDGRFWGAIPFDEPGVHTLQAVWGLGTPIAAESSPITVDVVEGPPSEGLTLDLVCHLVYRDATTVEVWSVVTGTAPAPPFSEWAPVSGSVHVTRPHSCWGDGWCSPTLDEQLWGFAAPAWGWAQPGGRTAFAAAAGPFTYRDTGLLPSCSAAWWSTARAHVEVNGQRYHAEAEDNYTGDHVPRVCG